MKCQDVCENLSAYLDGELDKGEASSIAAHLMACRHCRHEWEQLNTASALLRGLPEIEPPPEFMTGLNEKLATLPLTVADEEKNSFLYRVRQMVKKPWYKVAAAAAMFGLAFGVTQLWDNGNGNIINHPEINKMVITENQAKGSNSEPGVTVTDDAKQQSSDNSSVETNQPSTKSDTQSVSTSKGKDDQTTAETGNSTKARTEGVNKTTVTTSTFVANVYTLSIQIAVADDNITAAEQKVRDISAKYHGSLQESGNEFDLKFPRQGTDISLLLPEFNTIGDVSTVPMKDVIGDYKAQINQLEQKKADLNKQLDNADVEDAEKLKQQINQVQNDIDKKLAEVKELSNYINIIVKLVV